MTTKHIENTMALMTVHVTLTSGGMFALGGPPEQASALQARLAEVTGTDCEVGKVLTLVLSPDQLRSLRPILDEYPGIGFVPLPSMNEEHDIILRGDQETVQ
jgi:hypothetical protein